MSLNQTLARLSDIGGPAGVPFANRNAFIDGAFDNWTSSAMSITAANGQTYLNATMWMGYTGTGGSANITRVDARTNGIVGDSAPRNYLVWNQSVACTSSGYFLQKLEGAHKFAGKSVTISMKLWVGSGSITIPRIMTQQYFGTGGSPSAVNVLDTPINWVLTTSAKRFSFRMDIPAVTGKTFGTNGDDSLYVGIWLPTGVTYNMGVMEMQVEECSPRSSSDINGNGGAPTAFEYRGYEEELLRQLRYYETAFIPPTYYNLSPATPLMAYMQAITYLVPKRGNGSVSFAGIGYYSGGTPTTMPVGNIVVVGPGPNGVTLYLNGGMTNCAGCSGGQYTCDARL